MLMGFFIRTALARSTHSAKVLLMTSPELADRSTARARVAGEVRACMGRAAVTQAQLSRATGISHPTLSRKLKARLERDAFDVEELAKIASVLDVSLSEFFPAAVSAGPRGTVLTREYEPNKRAYSALTGHRFASARYLTCNKSSRELSQ